MNSSDRSGFLRASLRVNAAFSTLSGAVFLLGRASVGGLLEVPPPAVAAVGANLLGFAAALLWLASRPEIPRQLAVVVIGLDVAWVVATVAAVCADLLPPGGAAAALVVADAVLAFGWLQAIGVRRLEGAARASAPAGPAARIAGAPSRGASWTIALVVPLLAVAHILALSRLADAPLGPAAVGPFGETLPAPADGSGACDLRYAAREVGRERPTLLGKPLLAHGGALFAAARGRGAG